VFLLAVKLAKNCFASLFLYNQYKCYKNIDALFSRFGFSAMCLFLVALFKCFCLQQAAEGVQGAVCGFFLGLLIVDLACF